MTRASTRTRLSVLPVFIALIFNVMAPVVSLAVPDAVPEALAPQVATAADAPTQVTFTLEGCNLNTGAFIEASLTCTDAGYTTGNLGKLWAELDRVPHRLTAVNNNGAQTYEIKISADYLRTGTIGYDQISVPTVTSGPCTVAVSNQFVDAGQAGGADETISRTLTITQPADSTCVFDYNMRLALGSSGYSGSSLHAYLIAEGVGEKRVPLPVDKEFPAQELRKTMTATQGQAYNWSVSKSADPISLDFPNTCLTTAGARSTTVDVTVSWTRSGPTASGSTTVTTTIYAKNPSERTILVSASDVIYAGTGQTTPIDTASTASPVAVAANSEVAILTHTFVDTQGRTQFNDVATATYTDPVNPDVAIPGTTTATASATAVPAGGVADNASAVITDSEWITGEGLSFSVGALGAGEGTFTNGYVAGSSVLPGATVEWSSGTVSGSGSVTFTKTVSVDQPRITSGTLSDTAAVLPVSGGTALATSPQLDIPITTDADVVLTINKTIPSNALRTGESVTFEFEVYAGATKSGDPIATPSITFNAGGDTAQSVDVTGLAPGQYTVHEVPKAGWATLEDRGDTITLPDCAGSVLFDNTELVPDLTEDKVADDETVSAGDQIGFVISVSNGDDIGTGTAKDVEFVDNLPGGTGIDWEIAEDSLDGGACSIDGALGSEILTCDFGDLAPASSASVHVVSDTTAESCQLYENTAVISASNIDEPLRPFDDTEVLCGDVELEKTPLPDAELNDPTDNDVVVGDEASFTLLTTNVGGGEARGVVLVDELPAVASGWEISNSTWPAPGCAITGDAGAAQTLTCGGDEGVTLGADLSFSVTVSTLTTAADCGDLDNDAAVTTTNDGGDTDAGEIDVLCPDASVTKTADVGTINATDPATFIIEVSAGGTGPSTNVEVTDMVPAGHTWTVTGDIEACVGFEAGDTELSLAGGEELSCTYATIANGTSRSLTITTTSTTDDCADGISNTVSITADADVDTSDESNSDTASIMVECPDLELDKTGSNVVVAGDTVFYTLTVTNNGDGDAYDVVLTDDLPNFVTGGWDVSSTTGIPMEDCDVASNTLTCEIALLSSGASFSVTVEAVTDVTECPSLTNNAEVSASNEATDEVTQADNTDFHIITVNCPDTSVTKEASTPVVNAGDDATYEITVTAGGSGTNENVTLTDQLHGSALDWSFVVSGDGTDEDCSIDAEALLLCEFGDLEPDDSVTVVLTYSTNPDDCPSIANSATASATDDVDLEDNATDPVVITVNCPDVTVDKEPVESPVDAGNEGQFTLLVSNDGPGVAYDLEVVDTAPAGTVWTVLDADGFACEDEIVEGQQVVTCTLDELAAGASATILIGYTTSVEDCGTLENAVAVSAGNEPDAWVNEENSDTASIIVECPGLNLIKRQVDENGDPTTDPILAGEIAYFEILVWNSDDQGIGTAHDVVVTEGAEDLPDGVSWSIDAPDGVDCISANSEDPQSFECDLGDLEPGESVSIIVSGLTDRADCGALVNTARVDATNNDDEVPAAVATILVSCPEISIEKENDAVGSVLPGTTVGYTLTLNVNDEGLENGEATDVTVIDVMPVGLESPTNISDGGTFDAATRTITWELGNLGEGTYELTYDATVADDVENGEELVNAAAATSTNSQCPDFEELGPECTDDSTVIVRSPSLVIDKVADAEIITISGAAGALVADPAIVTWTLTYTLANGPVTNAVITDEIPAGFVFLDASDGGLLADGQVTWTFATLSESGSVTFRTTVDPETISRVAPTVNVAVIDSDQTEPDEGQDSVTVEVEAPVLGGNPTPKPKPVLPDTATGFGIDGEPISVPVELLVAFFIGSLGAATLANVKARSRRR